MRRQGRGPGCRSGGWGRGRGAGPGRHSGGEDKDVRARLLRNTQAGPAPRAWVVGSSSSAESCPWRTEPERSRAPPLPAGHTQGAGPARAGASRHPEPSLLSALCGQETRAQRGQAACPRGHSGSAEAPAPGAALHPARACAGPARAAGGPDSSCPHPPPARRTATVSSTRERPFGLLLREIFTREWEEIAPLSCPETNPLKAKAARCMGGKALESPVCAQSSQLTRLHLILQFSFLSLKCSHTKK